jgi:hypothetical protein
MLKRTDAEFWAHVFGIPEHGGYADYAPPEPDAQEIEELDLQARLADPCPECGQLGACAYDSEGRALIHVVVDDDT